MASVPEAVVTALVSSGFPFQTAIAATVPQAVDWKVLDEEFPWQDTAGADRFLDIAAGNEALFVGLECKKSQTENFIFLQPDARTGRAQRVRCPYLTQIRDSTRRIEVAFAEWFFEPESVESAFCVVTTSDKGRDQRLLERDAQLLVRGTDAYALFRKRAFKPTAQWEPDRPCVPVLVTNAPLFVAKYSPAAVSLESGQFALPPEAEIESVEWVRFAKPFTSHRNRDVGFRTVFVVRATALVRFLEAIALTGSGPSGRGRVYLPFD